MTEASSTTYIVSAWDSKDKTWKTVLSTKDEAEALAMKTAIKQDRVKVRIEALPLKKR